MKYRDILLWAGAFLCLGMLIPRPVQAAVSASPKFIVCDDPGNGPAFRQPEGRVDLIITCTKPGPFTFTIKGCIGPKVRQNRQTKAYTVTCERLLRYEEPVLSPGQ